MNSYSPDSSAPFKSDLPLRIGYAALFLVAYTAIWNVLGDKELKPWRILDCVLLLLGPFFWRRCRPSPSIYVPVCIFLCYLTIQPLLFARDVTQSDYSFLAAQYPLCALSIVMASMTQIAVRQVLRCLEISVIAACIYQYYQFISYYTLGPSYAAVLNDAYQVTYVGFYRIISGVYAPSSFLGEGGQLAMYIGPVLILLVVCSALDIYRPMALTFPLGVISILLTISIGGGLELLSFLAVTLLARFVGGARGNRKIWIFALLTGVAVVIFVATQANTDIANFFERRFSDIQESSSERQRGQAAYWDFVNVNPLFGYGFNTFRFTTAQPSHFISILADTGYLGAGLLVACFVSPVLNLLRHRRTLLLAAPIATSSAHMFAAYGSFQWPGVWCMAGICAGLAGYLRTREAPAEGTFGASRLSRQHVAVLQPSRAQTVHRTGSFALAFRAPGVAGSGVRALSL